MLKVIEMKITLFLPLIYHFWVFSPVLDRFLNILHFVFIPVLNWRLFDFRSLSKLGFSYSVSQLQHFLKAIHSYFFKLNSFFYLHHHSVLLLVLSFSRRLHSTFQDEILEIDWVCIVSKFCHCTRVMTPVSSVSFGKTLRKLDVSTEIPILYYGFLFTFAFYVTVTFIRVFTSKSLHGCCFYWEFYIVLLCF